MRTVLSNRHDVLRALCDGPATKPELVSTLSAARSTVDRAVRDLGDVGCVETVDGAYRATPTGHVALATYDDYTAATGAIDDARPFLDRLPARAPIDTAILRRAEVTLAEPHAPEVALEPCVELRGRAERLRGLAPVALSVCPRRITERVDTGELTVELVARENVVASLPALGEGPGARLLDDDAVTVYETDTSLPYVPWIIETSDGTVAGITACTDGRVRGLLINESDAAVAWATDRYTAYRREATPVGA